MSGKNRRARAMNNTEYLNTLYRRQYELQIYDLAISRFEWTGLDGTSITGNTLEYMLITRGSACVTNINGVLSVALVGSVKQWDIYGYPLEWQCLTLRGIDCGIRDTTNAGIIYNAVLPFESLSEFGYVITKYASILADIDRVADINRACQRTPVLFSAPVEQSQVVAEYARQIFGNTQCVARDTRFGDIDVQALNLGVPYLEEQLHDDRKHVWDCVYEVLGVPHVGYTKQERLIVSEAEGNEASTGLMLTNALNGRIMNLDTINKLFGTNINVSSVFAPNNAMKEGDMNGIETV